MAGIRFDWKVLRELGSGGQGRVSLVVKAGKDPILRIIEPLNQGLILSATPEEKLESLRRVFGDALLDFVDRKFSSFGALKELTTPTEEARARLQLEAKVYEKITDPHLLRIIDKNIDENWIVTEFQPNGTLESRLKTFRGDALKALRAIRPAVNVLAKMHAAGFTHRDFKPGNVFIGRDGEFVVGDAGLAFYEDREDTRITKTHENAGTRDYMPAWTYSQRSDIKPTFDVFSIGKMIWAMIAGRPTCRLWYVLRNEFNLMNLFPEKEEMFWVNELLKKCVVEEETEMQIRDGATMLAEMDSTIHRINMHALPPGSAGKLDRVICRLCWVGTYEDHTTGQPFRHGTCLRCNRCGHLEFFDYSS